MSHQSRYSSVTGHLWGGMVHLCRQHSFQGNVWISRKVFQDEILLCTAPAGRPAEDAERSGELSQQGGHLCSLIVYQRRSSVMANQSQTARETKPFSPQRLQTAAVTLRGWPSRLDPVCGDAFSGIDLLVLTAIIASRHYRFSGLLELRD